jgi:EAL domain-containing protein (putative c-di-GMP-specific phosphodiesterase class I)
MRLRAPDESIVAPGPLIGAAQRYQLLPSIDRWVVQRTLQMLAPYRTALLQGGMAFSLNVMGQSICDEDFVNQFIDQVQDAACHRAVSRSRSPSRRRSPILPGPAS